MHIRKPIPAYCLGFIILIMVALACSLPERKETSSAESDLRARELALALTETALASALQPTQGPPLALDTLPPPVEVVPTETETLAPSPTGTEVSHTLKPGEPGWVNRWFNDTSSKNYAGEKRAPGGDNLEINLIERPFSQNEMVYRPDLDIQYTELSLDSNFFYIKIFLAGGNPESNDLSGAAYGVELDVDLDGRGDYLIWANGPCTANWDIEGMLVYGDSNNNVGSSRPIYADAPNNADSYDQELFSLNNMQDPDAAWCRQKSSTEMQIAFKHSIVNNPKIFLWGVWADDGVRDPTQFDYNDTYTLEKAGSPLKNTSQYPLKELHQVDNTCRESYGYEAVGNEYGLCRRPTPTASPEPVNTRKPKPSKTPTDIVILL